MTSKPVVLIIMDGWGVAAPSRGNAATLARMPFLDTVYESFPTLLLEASGISVGLPWGEMGNSEVGHLTIGSGKIVYQSLARITQAIESGEFFKNPKFLEAIAHVKKNNSRLHLMGLLGIGGVHSHQAQLESLMQMAQDNGLDQVYVHVFLDGRDLPRNSGLGFLKGLQQRIQDRNFGQIADVSGRFWAMDRDMKWERTEAVYRLLTEPTAFRTAADPASALQQSYDQKVYDEEFEPTRIQAPTQTEPILIQDNDAVIFYNFRADRARQLSQAFVAPEFSGFTRQRRLNNLYFVTMTEYQKGLPAQVAFPREYIHEPLAKVISDHGLRQLHIAETEKYAHVTFFLNGLREQSFPGEERILVQSPLVDSYAKTPAMSSQQLVEKTVAGIESGHYQFIVVNFANPDMVGHTGNLEATVAALEADDLYLKQIIAAAWKKDATVLITADHGNCEEVVKLQTGEPDKEHSARSVPCILIDRAFEGSFPPAQRSQLYQMQSRGTLMDVAPTVLALLGLPKPPEMNGINLLNLLK